MKKQKLVRSIADYIDSVETVRTTWAEWESGSVWLRGVGNREKHKLLPSAYWHQNVNESSLWLEFLWRAPSVLSLQEQPNSDWEWYSLMRHHGLPTRLLDWSENPLVALYFAINASDSIQPSVWLLDPTKLNLKSVGDRAIIYPGGEFSENWLPKRVTKGDPWSFDSDGKRYSNSKPIAVEPRRTNARVIAQSGVFTVHGSDSIPLDIYMEAAPRSDAIRRIDIDPKAVGNLNAELFSLNIRKGTLVRDLDSLVADIKSSFNVTTPVPKDEVQDNSRISNRQLDRTGSAGLASGTSTNTEFKKTRKKPVKSSPSGRKLPRKKNPVKKAISQPKTWAAKKGIRD